MVSILLLEDEYYTRQYFKKLIYESPSVGAVFDTHNGEEAISFAQKHKPDIALLDIELAQEEKLNGIAVAKRIYDLHPDIFFVFITGYSQYALDSFAVHPYDYILKPVKEAEIKKLINNLAGEVKKNIRKPPLPMRVKNADETVTVMISPDEILFIEKQDRFSLIHTKKHDYKVGQTITELQERLGDNFLRVHRSFIVNVHNITEIKEVGNRSYEISFAGYDKVALMSRHGFKEHKSRFTSS